MTVSKKFDQLRGCGYNWFGQPVDPDMIRILSVALTRINSVILIAMDNPQNKFSVPYPRDNELALVVGDELDELMTWAEERKKNSLHLYDLGCVFSHTEIPAPPTINLA